MAEVQTPATEQVGAQWGAMDPAEVDNTAFFLQHFVISVCFCYKTVFFQNTCLHNVWT